MYNLPYVSYGIFAFVLVAVGLLAWKKGFKAALASLVLTMATVGIILGLTLVLFDYISPLFDSYLKKHFSGDGAYDYKILANAAKPQIIAVCIAIGFIPVFACLFGVTYPIYRLLKKKDFPITLKTLGSNSKKIKTSNSKFNKAGAIVATSVTALLTAGFATSASGVAFTTASSYNLFNDAMSWISYGTSFGFTKDSYSLHRMYDIIPLTNNKDLMLFSRILAPSSNVKENPTDATQVEKAIAENPDFNELKKIISKSETDAILSFLTSDKANTTSFSEKIYYPFIDSTIDVPQSGWRPLGNENSTTKYEFDLQEVSKRYSSTYFGFDGETKSKIVEWMKNNGIQKFDDTEASRLVQTKAKELEALKKDLAASKKLLSDREGYLKTFTRLKNDAIAKTQLDYASAVDWASKYNGLIASNGEIEKNKSIIAGLVSQRDQALIARNASGKTFEDYTGYAQTTSLSETPQYPGVVTANAQYTTLQSAISDATRATDAYNKALNDKNVASGKLPAQTTLIRNLTNDKNNLTSQITDKNSAIAGFSSTLTQLSTDIPLKDQFVAQKERDKTSVGELLKSNQENLAKLEGELAALKQQNADQQKIDDAKQAVDVAKVTINNQQTSLGRINSDLATAKTELINLTKGQQSVQNQLTVAQGELNALNEKLSGFNGVEQQLSDANNTLNDLNQKIDYWNTHGSTLEKTMKDAATIKNNAELTANGYFKDYFDKFNDYRIKNNTAQSAIDAQKSRIDQANQVASSINTAFGDYVKDIQKVEKYTGQESLLTWKVASAIPGVQINNSLESEFASMPQVAISFDSSNGSYQLALHQFNPANLSQPLMALNVPTDPSALNGLDLDDAVRKDIIAKPKTNYEYSIPFLANAVDPSKNNLVSLPIKNENYGPLPKDIVSKKDIKDPSVITEATEGKIAAIEYNIKENERGAKEVFVPYKEAKLKEYNQNVDDYLKIFDKYLGVAPIKKP